MDWGYVGAVVVSGLVIVFVALILLIAMVWLMGRFFVSGGNKKPGNAEKAPAQAEPLPAGAAQSEQISEDSEVAAVIAAAVAAMSEESGVPMRIKSIKPAKPSQCTAGRGAWAAAAAREAARTF